MSKIERELRQQMLVDKEINARRRFVEQGSNGELRGGDRRSRKERLLPAEEPADPQPPQYRRYRQMTERSRILVERIRSMRPHMSHREIAAALNVTYGVVIGLASRNNIA